MVLSAALQQKILLCVQLFLVTLIIFTFDPRELEKEIAMMNTKEFKWGVNWQQVLKSLVEDHQDIEDPEAKKVSSK